MNSMLLISVKNIISKIFKNQLNKERFFLMLLITLLVIVWFRKGLIIGSGESGLPFYNSSKLMEEVATSWTDVPFGTNSAIGASSHPFYYVIVLMQNVGIPSFVVQAFMYWLIFVVGVLSVHKIASLVADNSMLTRMSSSLFYIFNPVVHISVLHRLQYPLMFFYSLMPLAFLVYIFGLNSKKLINLLILSLICVLFSFAFIGISSVELMFGMLFFFSLAYFISTFKSKIDFFPFFYFLAFVFIFVLLNVWWLTPFFASIGDIGTRGGVKYFSSNDNVVTFKGISDQIGSVLSVFRFFKPNEYPKDESAWGWIYSTTPFILLSFSFIFAFIIGLFKKSKDLLYRFLVFMSLVVLFWAKGTLPPFGGITLYLFQRFVFLQVFRNPLEKIGLLLPFVMAIPIGFGMAMIVHSLSRKLRIPKKIAAFITLMIVFPLYMFPILTGLAFTGGPPPANNMDIGQYVKVPTYYKDAREWLDKQKGLFRVLVLPIDGEGMTYKWEYGYSGVELSNNLFNQSMISFNTSQAYLPELTEGIKRILATDPTKLRYLAQILNIKYIMVRDDIDYIGREVESPQRDLDLIKDKTDGHFSKVADFGKLSFFELNSEEFNPRVSASLAPAYLFDPLGKSLALIPFSNLSSHDVFITTSKPPIDDPFIKYADKIVVNGVKVENININTKDPVENLPYVSVYRDTPFYALVRLKEEIQSQFQTPDTQLAFRVNLLGKRLVEINHSPENAQAIDEYIKLAQSIGEEMINSGSTDKSIIESLLNQRQALDEIKQKTNMKEQISSVIAYLDSLFVNLGAKSVYPTQKDRVYRFYVPRDSQYEILVAKEDWDRYFQDPNISEFDLDGKSIKLNPSQQVGDKDTFNLGSYQIKQGFHEVSISSLKTLNLITEKLPDELVLSSKDRQPLTKTIPIDSLNNSYSYMISFEYFEEKGNVPVVSLHSDVDFIDKNGEKIPRFGIALTRDNYDFGWKKYSGQFTPLPTSSNYELAIKIIPYGDCKAIVQRPYRRYCEDNKFNQRFLRDSSTKIRNLKVEKVFLNPIILREVKISPLKQGSIPQISFEKISPARYKVKVTAAKNPFFLVLSTSFDPRWRAYFTNNEPKSVTEILSGSISGTPVPPDSHLTVNSYANGWYIDKLGDYEMFLEYYPERVFVMGYVFSVISITGGVLFLLLYHISRITKHIKKRD